MSTIEPGGIVQYEGDPARRRAFVAIGLVLVVAAGVAAYLEPWFFLERVREAVREDDRQALEQLVEPYVLAGPLETHLEASRPRRGVRIEQGYDSFSRFVVRAWREWQLEPGVVSTSMVNLQLERHGLSWRLADITTEDRTSDLRPGLPPPPIAGLPADSLPPFGAYVYVDELPEPEHRVAPAYPAPAREAGVEGTVLVHALIGRDGRVRETRIGSSVPPLDQAAVAAVCQWRFRPARSKGEPVAVWVAVPVRFTLR